MNELLNGLFALLIFPGGLFGLTFGLLLKGIDRRVVARLQRRIGPPILQPMLDAAKLCTKEVMIPSSAHPAALCIAPVLALAGALLCMALIPIPGVTEGMPFTGDLFVLLYLFPFPAIALMLAGAASGSPYGSLGLSREMMMMLAYEAPLLLILLTVSVYVGTLSGTDAEFSLSMIVGIQQIHGSFGYSWMMLPALIAWIIFLPATLGVPPFDIPEAETELLEGPLLEYSGPLLGIFHLASAVKSVVALSLGVILFFPGSLPVGGPAGILLNTLWFMIKCGCFMFFGLSAARAGFGRFRIEQAIRFFLTIPTGLALLSLILVMNLC